MEKRTMELGPQVATPRTYTDEYRRQGGGHDGRRGPHSNVGCGRARRNANQAGRSAPDRAEGFTLFTFCRSAGTGAADALPLAGPAMMGECTGQFRLMLDGWRIARRDIRTVFQVPG